MSCCRLMRRILPKAVLPTFVKPVYATTSGLSPHLGSLRAHGIRSPSDTTMSKPKIYCLGPFYPHHKQGGEGKTGGSLRSDSIAPLPTAPLTSPPPTPSDREQTVDATLPLSQPFPHSTDALPLLPPHCDLLGRDTPLRSHYWALISRPLSEL